jgi:hypothetical protein
VLVNCACASSAGQTTVDVFNDAHREVRAALGKKRADLVPEPLGILALRKN